MGILFLAFIPVLVLTEQKEFEVTAFVNLMSLL